MVPSSACGVGLPASVGYIITDGSAARRTAGVIGMGALLGVTMGFFEYTGGRLDGWKDQPTEDEYERKQRLRREQRRPIEETIAELGEGRGESTLSMSSGEG